MVELHDSETLSKLCISILINVSALLKEKKKQNRTRHDVKRRIEKNSFKAFITLDFSIVMGSLHDINVLIGFTFYNS